MSFESLLTQTLTVIRISQTTPTADSEGNATHSTAAETSVPGLIQQRAAAEVVVGPDTLISDYILFVGPAVAIDGRDRVRDAAGTTYEVIAKPAVIWTPLGPHHIEADLQLITN